MQPPTKPTPRNRIATLSSHCIILLLAVTLLSSQAQATKNFLSRRSSKISHLAADHLLDKSLHLFAANPPTKSTPTSLRCNFDLLKVHANLTATPSAHVVEWLKYDPRDLKLLSIFPSLADDSSELNFSGSLNESGGVYVCKLKQPGRNSSLIANNQFIQRINFNGNESSRELKILWGTWTWVYCKIKLKFTPFIFLINNWNSEKIIRDNIIYRSSKVLVIFASTIH